eukprot:CAMPEP_0201568680 /NCGR_PEP_ID=MMETSP0190_2-20130828/9902_1 /ASSEMBLY_ACC=CAM_ASM_000263 /TAXON_ID=37353 /ORGANISM="Rosalina sp." /LENGTH=458 /DNA_ID=CAMNT_0047990079 /DNA_START=29 /DNA_END=1405 /DNA_ORIENTATION=-
MALHFDRNQEATVWIGGLDENVDESLLWELMIQAGPVVSVNIPRDKITHEHQGYAFCEFASEEDADYAMKIMNMVRLFGKSLKINKASRDRKDTGVGANVFVGNLDPEVDDQLLYNTFSAFGQVLSAKVMYEDDGTSRGFAFVNFADFDSSDAAILHMNGQFLCNRPVHVSYAYKKDTKGEKHGSETERLFAAKMQAKSITRPHMHFASTAPQLLAASLGGRAGHGASQQQVQAQSQAHITPNSSLLQQQNPNGAHIVPNSSLIGHQLPPNSSLIGHPHAGGLMAHHLNPQYTPATAQAIQNAALIQQAAMMHQQQMAAARLIQQHQQRAQQAAMAAAQQAQVQAQQQAQAQQQGDQKDEGGVKDQQAKPIIQSQAPPPPNPMFLRGPPPVPPPGMFGAYPGFMAPRPPFMPPPPNAQPPPGPPPPMPPQQQAQPQPQPPKPLAQSDGDVNMKGNDNQ